MRSRGMAFINASLIRAILTILDYEILAGSNNPVSEHWVSPEGTPFFFVYAKKGDRDRFLEQPVREFLQGLSPQSLHKVRRALDEPSSREP